MQTTHFLGITVLKLLITTFVLAVVVCAALELNIFAEEVEPLTTSAIDCNQARDIAEGIVKDNKSAINWERLTKINTLQDAQTDKRFNQALIDAELINELGEVSNVNVTNSIITGDLNFSPETEPDTENSNKEGKIRPLRPINHEMSFKGTIFLGEVNFSGVQFLENVNFESAKFCGTTKFNYAGFFKNAVFRDARFYKDADFFDAQFAEASNVTFSGATFNKVANFYLASFGEADPSRVILYDDKRTEAGPCKYSRVLLSKSTKFIKTRFMDHANFKSALFNNDAMFNNSIFESTADFNKARFCLDADFNAAEFRKPVYFKQAEFHKTLVLQDAKFTEYIDLRLSKIKKLNFKNDSIPNFISAIFDLRHSKIGEAHFEDIVFEDDVNFFKTEFGKTDFSEWAQRDFVEIGYGANIDIDPEGYCDDYHLKHHKPAAVFRDINFESDAVFLKTEFCGRTAFEKVNFEKTGNFIDVDFKCGKYNPSYKDKDFSLSYLTFSEFNFRLNRMPPTQNWVDSDKYLIETSQDCMNREESGTGLRLQRLSELFEDFEATFKQHERFEDQILASRHMKSQRFQEMLTGASNKSFLGKHLSILSSGEFWIYVFWGWNSQYGTNLKRMLFTCVFFFFFFSLVYFTASRIWTVKDHEGSVLRLIEVPVKYFTRAQPDSAQDSANSFTDRVRKVIDSMHFSMILLFKIGHGNIEVSDNFSIKFIAWIEWLIGYWFLLILALTLLNTVPIINTIAGALL